MPELTSKDGYYTKKQIRELQDFAILRGVVITPEIDAPGHAFCFTHLRPELRHPKLGDSYLDVTNPETIKLMKSIFDEFIPLFKSSDVHIGTDEYRRGAANKEEWAILGESFRKYINIMNRYIRDKHGKTVRIWSGWEHMPGVTQPDTNIVIDMWVSSDAVSKSNAGYKYINSNHGRTYIVPGAGYYGVNNVALYNKWTPAVFTGNKKKDPSPDDPNLLGAKLHIWNDMGPSGYTMYEIADLAMPTLFVMSEKMWGTKASANYDEFTVRAAKLKNIPDVRLLQREVNAIDREKGIIFDSGDTVYTLTTPDESIPLMKYLCDTGDEHKNLEFPWTISMQIKPADGVEQIAPATILSSRIAELQADFRFTTSSRNRKTKVVTKTNHSGLGLERLNKYTSKPLRCSSSQSSRAASSVQLPNGRFSTLTCVGMRRATKIYLDGKQIAEFTGRRSQFICPLETVGTYPGRGKGFVGEIKFLKIYNRALDKNAIDKLVKLKLSVNIARNARVKVSQSDTAHNLTPEKMLDGNTYARSSRWSSGKTKTPASVILDLGKPRTINEIRLYWESAYPKNYSVEISADGKNFRAISTTRGKPGLATVKIPPANARFIRVNMENPATQWGYSLYEIEILGE
jgi:hexosaminidase